MLDGHSLEGESSGELSIATLIDRQMAPCRRDSCPGTWSPAELCAMLKVDFFFPLPLVTLGNVLKVSMTATS